MNIVIKQKGDEALILILTSAVETYVLNTTASQRVLNICDYMRAQRLGIQLQLARFIYR